MFKRFWLNLVLWWTNPTLHVRALASSKYKYPTIVHNTAPPLLVEKYANHKE